MRTAVVPAAIFLAVLVARTPAPGQSALVILPLTGTATAIVNQPFSLMQTALGGQAPYEWTMLPSGFTGAWLGGDGTFSATFDAPGTYVFAFVVKDQLGLTATKLLTVTVTYPPIAMGAEALPKAAVGEPYSAMLTAGDGVPPFLWSVSGALPPGIVLSADGILSGTPTRWGEFPVEVTATDSVGTKNKRSIVLVVDPAPLRIATQALPPAVVGLPYQFQLTPKNGTAPYRWTITGGALSEGLRLDPSGLITGKPAAVGSYSVQIQVRDARTETVSGQFGLLVTEKVRVDGKGTIRTVAGSALQSQLIATGGVAPYTFSSDTPLPPGVDLRFDGFLMGTPRTAGRWTLSVQVADTAGNRAASKIPFEVIPATLTVRETAKSALFAAVGTPYIASFGVGDGYPPYKWSIESGALPAGLTLNSNGEVRGAPKTMGAYRFAVAAEDSTGTTGRTEAEILVTAAQLSAYSDLKIPFLPVAFPYRHRLSAAGGAEPYQWTVSGSPQLGAAIDIGGTLSMSPKETGLFSYTAIVTDATGARASYSESIRVVPSLQELATSSKLPGAVRDRPYAANLTVLGGQGKRRWTLRGDLPRGLEFDPDKGWLSGVPEEIGEFGFFLRVTDEYGQVTERPWILKSDDGGTPDEQPFIGAVTNAFGGGTLAVGAHEWVSIRGENLGPAKLVETPAGGPVFSLGGVRVLLDGRPLALVRVSAKEIVAVIGEGPAPNPVATLEVDNSGLRSDRVMLTMARDKLTIITAESMTSAPNVVSVQVNGKVTDWTGLTVTLNGVKCDVTGVDPIVEWPGLYTLWLRSQADVRPQSVLRIATQSTTVQAMVTSRGL